MRFMIFVLMCILPHNTICAQFMDEGYFVGNVRQTPLSIYNAHDPVPELDIWSEIHVNEIYNTDAMVELLAETEDIPISQEYFLGLTDIGRIDIEDIHPNWITKKRPDAIEIGGKPLSLPKLKVPETKNVEGVVRQAGCEISYEYLNPAETSIWLMSVCKDENGLEYLKPSTDPKSYINYRYLKNGFTNVIAVARHLPSLGGNAKQCSGTLIAPRYVITAAHCLALSDHDATIIYNDIESLQNGWWRFGVMDDHKFQIWHNTWFDDDITKVTGEMYKVAYAYTPIAPNAFSRLTNPNTNGALLKHDIAILELERAVENTIAFAEIDGPQNDANRITFAGYGYTLSQYAIMTHSQAWYKTLLATVNWHLGDDDDNFLYWKNSPDRNASAPCQMDSGGPVFDGFEFGVIDTPKRLVAITVAGDKPAQNGCEIKTGKVLKIAPFADEIHSIVFK